MKEKKATKLTNIHIMVAYLAVPVPHIYPTYIQCSIYPTSLSHISIPHLYPTYLSHISIPHLYPTSLSHISILHLYPTSLSHISILHLYPTPPSHCILFTLFYFQIKVRVTTMDAELELAIEQSTTGKQLFDQVQY